MNRIAISLCSLFVGVFTIFANTQRRDIELKNKVAYNLKRFNDVPVYIYNIESQETRYFNENTTRHSLSFGVGITI